MRRRAQQGTEKVRRTFRNRLVRIGLGLTVMFAFGLMASGAFGGSTDTITTATFSSSTEATTTATYTPTVTTDYRLATTTDAAAFIRITIS